MIRRRISKKRAAWELGIAGLFAVICILVLIDVHDSEASKPHVWVSGVVDEWRLTSGRSPALIIRLNREPMEFRVDSIMFREAMDRVVPPGLGQGAQVSVLVHREEHARPTTPLFDQSVQIAFVRGLRIDRKEIFGLSAARSWEERNQAWSYVLFVAALAGLIYAGSRWRRARSA